jgi:hypothetical protein
VVAKEAIIVVFICGSMFLGEQGVHAWEFACGMSVVGISYKLQ